MQMIKVLTHPFFIGLVITGLIVAFMFPEIPRFRVTIEHSVQHSTLTGIHYNDLNQDGLSEEINIDRNPEQLKIMLFSGPRLIDQYNFSSRPLDGKFITTGDYNLDGLKELYLVTMAGDSLLLSIIDPFGKEGYLLYERPVFYQDTIEFVDLPRVFYCGFTDYSGDGYPELLFAITSGYSKRPRSVYRYDIAADSLLVSPLSAANIRSCRFCNLDKDSVPELLLETDATGNYPADYPYLDYSAWLMVLDGDLQFRFGPVEFRGFPSKLRTEYLPVKDSAVIAVLHDYYGDEPLRSGVYIYSPEGIPLIAKELDLINRGRLDLTADMNPMQPLLFMIDAENSVVTKLNSELEVLGELKIPPLYDGRLFAEVDADSDGENEMFFYGKGVGTLVIFRKHFRHPVTIDFKEDSPPHFLYPYSDREENLVFVGFDETGYFVKYRFNGWYIARYPFVLAFYAAVSLLIMGVYRVQRFRAERHFQTQRKIGELQILSLKNQIDPHFTFNILNSLGHLYTNSDLKERSYDLFVKYSRLLRKSVENSDKISVSLRNELDFVSAYVELEQLRSHPPFQFHLEVGREVDLEKTIPRMLIHTFIENAIKHGIHGQAKENAGELGIRVARSDRQTTITIRDNGPGLRAGRGGTDPVHESPPSSAPAVGGEHLQSTGRGLRIIKEMIRLFHTLEGVKISTFLNEVVSDNGRVEGTEVIIKVPD
jgi:anti-sigma regulatory factor (Ser/Thr protein kinase)